MTAGQKVSGKHKAGFALRGTFDLENPANSKGVSFQLKKNIHTVELKFGMLIDWDIVLETGGFTSVKNMSQNDIASSPLQFGFNFTLTHKMLGKKKTNFDIGYTVRTPRVGIFR